MTTYFWGTNGSDTNNGLSEATPFASMAKLKELSDNNRLSGEENTLALRCGDVYPGRMEISMPIGSPILKVVNYGSGPDPIIDCYKYLNNPAIWTETAPQIWRVDLTLATGAFTGNRMSSSANTAFLLVDGVQAADKKFTLPELTQQWQFYDDGVQYLYVRSNGNPTNKASDLRASVNTNGVTLNRNVEISGFAVRGAGGHGVRIVHATNQRITLAAMEIYEIGGATLDPGRRFGNGIEIWVGGNNITMDDMHVHDVYDSGITLQGPTNGGSGRGWRDITIRRPRIERANQALEFWATNTQTGGTEPNYGFERILIDQPLCISSGYSFGAEVRSDNVGKGLDIMTYSMEVPTDILIKDGVFWNARDAYTYANTNNNTLVPGLRLENNDIFLRPGAKVQWQRPETIEQGPAWSTATGKDRTSRFHIVPDAVSTSDDALTYLAGNAALAQARAGIQSRALASVRGRVERVSALINSGRRTHVLTPSPGFWEHDPNYAPVTMTLINGVVYLSGAMRRASNATAINMADGIGYGATSVAIPSDMLPRARRTVRVLIFPQPTMAGAYQGFVDVSNTWTELRVGSIGAVSLNPGVGRIVFDGSSYVI
jgi:hypothetical protein